MPASPVMKQALQDYLDRFNARDLDGIVALYAEDASVEDPFGRPPTHGRAAIREFYRSALKTNATLRLATPIRGSHGDSAAMAFDVCLPLPQGETIIRVIDVMRFNEAGLVTSMRAYWGPDDMGPALGA